MLQAMSLYSNQARGSASQKFAELLVEECTNYWMAGRQACEELSLTGKMFLIRKCAVVITNYSKQQIIFYCHTFN